MILKKNMRKNGKQNLVNYRGVKKEKNLLVKYLGSLTAVSKKEYNAFSKNEKLAFLINAYNAFTVKLIVDNFPLESIKKLGSLFTSPWKKKFFILLEEERSLDGIEHDMIRKNFNEPRIHFAVNCASIGCPNLYPEAFYPTSLNSQLEKATFSFITDRKKNRWNLKKQTLNLSKIFKWYKGDFKKKFGSVPNFLATYFTQDISEQQLIKNKSTRIDYMDYDWNLNGY